MLSVVVLVWCSEVLSSDSFSSNVCWQVCSVVSTTRSQPHRNHFFTRTPAYIHHTHTNTHTSFSFTDQKSPLTPGACRPHLIHQCLGRSYSPPQMAARSLHTLSHNYCQKPYWLQWDAYPSKNYPLAWGNSQFQPPASSWEPADPILKTASTSNQLFFHNLLGRLTNRPTDGPGNKICTNACLHSINNADAANDTKCHTGKQHTRESVQLLTEKNLKQLVLIF